MKSILSIIALAVVGFLPVSTQAVPIQYEVLQGGYENGGVLRGSFLADDTNADGSIFYNYAVNPPGSDVVSGSFTYTDGNSVVTSFILQFLDFNLTTLSLGAGGEAALPFLSFFDLYPAPDARGAVVLNPFTFVSSTESLMISSSVFAAPAPALPLVTDVPGVPDAGSTILLLGLALCGLLLHGSSKSAA